MNVPLWGWIVFNLGLLGVLALDLGLFHRKSHIVTQKEAIGWSLVWVALAMAFAAGLFAIAGAEVGISFLTAYLIEKSLSVENVFVFSVIFSALGLPRRNEHQVLFWGVMGALVLRAMMIFAGVALLARFSWLIYLFGAFLILTGVKMWRSNGVTLDPQNHAIMRLFRRWIRSTPEYEGDRFFVRRDGLLFATPLFAVLIVVEISDVLFALDSIPAILAITKDPFLVYTSNAFAILGLRSLYFVLAGAMNQLIYLNRGLAAILSFVGTKMIVSHFVAIPILFSLGVILGILVISIVASLRHRERQPDDHVSLTNATGESLLSQ